jgi:hypothetical protein
MMTDYSSMKKAFGKTDGKVDSINKSKVHSINKGKVIGIPLLLSTLFQLNHGCQLYWRTQKNSFASSQYVTKLCCLYRRGSCGRDHMIVRYTLTYAINVYDY